MQTSTPIGGPKAADNDAKPREVTPGLLARYDRPGPRYTSYPTAPVWSDAFGDEDYRAALGEAARRESEPLSLYVHIPFCHERCAFCGCNVIISKKEGVEDRYLDYVSAELEMVSRALGKRRRLSQLHWGGGTPTFLGAEAINRLFRAITKWFEIEPGAELALEVDPRVTTREQIELLRGLGFNRVSMGVQDLDPDVQCEIHRYQTEEQTRRMMSWCRETGFGGINMDLIYGLPGQRLDRWNETIRKCIEIRPDRLAVYSYAYLPDRLRNQRHIDATKLPDTQLKYQLFASARALFLAAGYRAIGMDHFALPTDELAHALAEGRLYRNFMGYTVVPATDLIGVGVSAIGETAGCFAQNEKKLSRYYEALDAGKFATACGCRLTDDDKVRAWVIRQIMCNLFVDKAEFARRFGRDFDAYFQHEQEDLRRLEADEFVVASRDVLRVLPVGQVFLRNVAMVFDAYLNRSPVPHAFSRTV